MKSLLYSYYIKAMGKVNKKKKDFDIDIPQE